MREWGRSPVPGCFLLIGLSAGFWRSRFLLGSGDSGSELACPAGARWCLPCCEPSVCECEAVLQLR